jgi:hypothetical protein
VLSAAFLRGNGVIRRTQQVIQVDDNDTTHKHKERLLTIFVFLFFPAATTSLFHRNWNFFFVLTAFEMATVSEMDNEQAMELDRWT